MLNLSLFIFTRGLLQLEFKRRHCRSEAPARPVPDLHQAEHAHAREEADRAAHVADHVRKGDAPPPHHPQDLWTRDLDADEGLGGVLVGGGIVRRSLS